eukprot:1144617-Pelagomonas_calceolata.AAC.1
MVTFWEGAYEASGSCEADCMFLIVEPVPVRYWKIVRFKRVETPGMFQKALLMSLFARGSSGNTCNSLSWNLHIQACVKHAYGISKHP